MEDNLKYTSANKMSVSNVVTKHSGTDDESSGFDKTLI